MFRRPGKNPLDDTQPIFQDDASLYKYGLKKQEVPPQRIFDSPLSNSIATPMQEREENWGHEKAAPIPHHFIKEEEPETTLGEGVSFRGELSFERLLRIDGSFEGELLSQGKVIVGPHGKVKANLNLREATIEGHVEGNITVQERLELRGAASVKGDIKAKSLCVDEGVSIVGHVQVSMGLDTSSNF